MKTFYPDLREVERGRRWHVLDAGGAVLGRLASRAAGLLKGKHKPLITPSIDCGDFVIVINAARVRLTGNKLESKTYFSHSGYAGGAKVVPVKRVLARDPRKVVYLAVRRMLDDNRFRARQMARLKIYAGAEHPHAAQLAAPDPAAAARGSKAAPAPRPEAEAPAAAVAGQGAP